MPNDLSNPLSNPLSNVRIVLMEPAGALNVGSIARIMKNMELRQLVLVNPQCDPLSDEARKMAVHAADVLESALRVQTLPEALQGCHRVIATTGRSDTTLKIPLEPPRSALPWLIAAGTDSTADVAASASTNTALIFGREDRGLTNQELNYAQRLVYIPSSPEYESLNLAQAVAICCYELYSSINQPSNQPLTPAPPTVSPPSSPAIAAVPENPPTFEAVEAYHQQLEALLLRIGYLYPHTAASRMEKLRRLLQRSSPSIEEVAMLRGILRQVEWALGQTVPPNVP
jgi:tRNA/rRNA methyltransferase